MNAIFDESGNRIESPDLIHGYLEHVSETERVYHEYSKEDKERIDRENEEARNNPTQEQRISALEAQLAAYEAAYHEGVQSV